MSDPMKDAWSEVADSFAALGRTMKERFERPDEPADPAAKGRDPTAALREAFEQLLAAGRDLGDRVTGITRDETLKTQARTIGSTINQAVEATINQLSGEMRGFFKGSGPHEAPLDTRAADADEETRTRDAPPDDAVDADDPPHAGV